MDVGDTVIHEYKQELLCEEEQADSAWRPFAKTREPENRTPGGAA
ncbi:hypothetical protein GPA27_28955 [Aromatoleum toluolicum]|nr:hypothetical protein [Aromatoleum toluolicum]MCQ6964001.1 hypothetical protein [Aromatoleum toluolicum]